MKELAERIDNKRKSVKTKTLLGLSILPVVLGGCSSAPQDLLPISHIVEKGHRFTAYPGAVVTGDVRVVLDSGLGGIDYLWYPVTLNSDIYGPLLEVHSKVSIVADHGAYVGYPKQGQTQEQLVQRQLKGMLESPNCRIGCLGVGHFSYSEQEVKVDDHKIKEEDLIFVGLKTKDEILEAA